jgi:hypothetical protein
MIESGRRPGASAQQSADASQPERLIVVDLSIVRLYFGHTPLSYGEKARRSQPGYLANPARRGLMPERRKTR